MKHRKQNRLRVYDYSNEGLYFVTIATKHSKCYFGKIYGDQIILSPIGHIANDNLKSINDHFEHVSIEKHIIMPNHIHAIIEINIGKYVGGAYMRPSSLKDEEKYKVNCPGNEQKNVNPTVSIISTRDAYMRPLQTDNRSKMVLSKIIQQYKASVSREVNRNLQTEFHWQRSFYDHIIRNDKAHENIWNYIHFNPYNWSNDPENPDIPLLDDRYYEKLFC